MRRRRNILKAILLIAGRIACFLVCCAVVATAEELPAVPQTPDGGTLDIAREHARSVKSELTASSHSLGGWIDRVGRDTRPVWMNRPLFQGISGARFVASLLLLVIVSAFTLTVVRIIRTRAGRIESGEKKSWPQMLWSAGRKPLALVLLLYGVYFSLSILFDAIDPAAPLSFLGKQLANFTYAGLIIAFFWFLLRSIKGAQKKMQAWADHSAGILDKVLVPVLGTALRLLIPGTALVIVTGAVDLPPPYAWIVSKSVGVFIIGSVAFLIIRTTLATEKVIMAANRLDVADNLRARQIYTQVSVIRRIIVVGIGGLAVASALMLFQPVRQLGTSILASAGIAGIVLGLAAQKTLSNFFAGIQIAISQPIRIDDVVIVEGEWGRIEEIALTYVTVCIWDLRRLVLPISYFIEKPFQNWTRTSARLLNSVFLFADYTLPIEPLRQELRRLLEANPCWDGDVCGLQVTGSTAQAMEIRCLMSSLDASKGWNLKCEIREGLLNFIQANYPASLPRVRAELRRDGLKPEPEILPKNAAEAWPDADEAQPGLENPGGAG
jgi:small-conductance mechanosensitive channel